MKKWLTPLTVFSVLLLGWSIQHFGSSAAHGFVVARSAASAADYDNDAARRNQQGMPHHWSALVLRR
jgi:hypothetical protein